MCRFIFSPYDFVEQGMKEAIEVGEMKRKEGVCHGLIPLRGREGSCFYTQISYLSRTQIGSRDGQYSKSHNAEMDEY